LRRVWRISSAKILTRDEVRSILAKTKASDERDYLVFATAANTGFRVSEVLHLQPSDVGEGIIIVRRRKKQELRPEEHPVSADLSRLLAKRVSAGGKERWVFPGEAGPCKVRGKPICDGGHVSIRHIERLWTAYLKSLRLWKDGRGIHSLRHYAGTEFYSEHRDLVATRDFLGHSSATVTETYAHAVEMREKVDKIVPVL
jgi:integrase